jgi:hypothetical protein
VRKGKECDDTEYPVKRIVERMDAKDGVWYKVLWGDNSRSWQEEKYLSKCKALTAFEKKKPKRSRKKGEKGGRGGGPEPEGVRDHAGVRDKKDGEGGGGRASITPRVFGTLADAPLVFKPFIPLPPRSLAQNATDPAMFPLDGDSLCLLKTIASLVGEHVLTEADMTKMLTTRGEKVYEGGWHSVKQANAALDAKKSGLSICKACIGGVLVPRIVDFTRNAFLQWQDRGLFLIQATTRSVRSRSKRVKHFVGLDCDRREFVDTYVSTRRAMTAEEWERIGVVDWQQTYVLCRLES